MSAEQWTAEDAEAKVERLQDANRIIAGERDAWKATAQHLTAELERITREIEAEREKTRDLEGATLRDENVLNGIVNGLGIALRIVRGERS